MNNQRRVNKQRSARKGRNRQRRAKQRQANADSYGPLAVRVPQIPKEFSYNSSFQGNISSVAATTEQFTTFGLVEFLGRKPLYTNEMYTIYRYCRITAVDIIVEAINIGTGPCQFGVGIVPEADVAALTFDEFVEKPGTTRKILSLAGGMDRGTIRRSFATNQWIGQDPTNKYWITSAQAASGTSLDSQEPCLVVGRDDLISGGTAYSITLQVRITYHMHYFDLNTPATS